MRKKEDLLGQPQVVVPPKDSPWSVGFAEAVRCDTTKGKVDILLHREWSPMGVERFLPQESKTGLRGHVRT